MLRNRLLAIGILLFALSDALCVYSHSLVLMLCFEALTVLCCLIGVIRFLSIKTAVIFSLIPLLAFAYSGLYGYLLTYPAKSAGNGIYTVTASVTASSGSGGTQSVTARVIDAAGGLPEGTLVRVYPEISGETVGVSIGDAVNITGTFIPADGRPSLLADRITFYSYGDIAKVGHSESFFTRLRSRVSASCDAMLPADVSAFVKAITVGDTSSVSRSDYYAYSVSGSAHLLAVSGLHMSLIVMAMYYLLIRLSVNRKAVICICVALAFFCLALTGFSLSAARAVLMLTVFLVSQLFRLRSDTMTSLFIALGVLLLLNPLSIASLSLQLSFLSTLGIICFSGAFEAAFRGKQGLFRRALHMTASPFIFSVASFAFTVPCTVSSFDKISLISPVSNIISGIVFPFILIFSYAFAALALIAPAIAAPAAFLLSFIAKLFIGFCEWISGFSVMSVSSHTPGLIIVVLICAAFVLLLLCLPSKPRRIAAAVCVCVIFVSVAGVVIYGNAYRASRCIVCSSRGSICVTDSSETLLVDSGGSSDSAMYLSGVTKGDTVLFTSLGSNSAASARYYITCLGVRSIAVPLPEDSFTAGIADELRAVADESGCAFEIYEGVYSRAFGNAFVECVGGAVTVTAYGQRLKLSPDSDISAAITDDGVCRNPG